MAKRAPKKAGRQPRARDLPPVGTELVGRYRGQEVSARSGDSAETEWPNSAVLETEETPTTRGADRQTDASEPDRA